LIDTCNKFSHGEIEYELNGKAILVYYDNVKKEIKLNNEYFDGLNNLFKETSKSLNKIIPYI